MKLKNFTNNHFRFLLTVDIAFHLSKVFSFFLSCVSLVFVIFADKDNSVFFEFMILFISFTLFFSVLEIVFANLFSQFQLEFERKTFKFQSEFDKIKELLNENGSLLKNTEKNVLRISTDDKEENYKQYLSIASLAEKFDNLEITLKSTCDLREKIQSLNYLYMTSLVDSKISLVQKTLIKSKVKELDKLLSKFYS